MRPSRGYIAIGMVGALAATLLGVSAVLSAALWRGQRTGIARDRTAAARLAVESALTRAVAECRIEGAAWTPPADGGGVVWTVERSGVVIWVTVRATDPTAPVVRRIDIIVRDQNAPGAKVVSVVERR